MAMAASSSSSFALSLNASADPLLPIHPSLLHHPQFRLCSRPSVFRLSSRIQASSAATLEPIRFGVNPQLRISIYSIQTADESSCSYLAGQFVNLLIFVDSSGKEIKGQWNNTLETDPFACPVCYEPLIRKGPPGVNLPAIYRSGFKCKLCNKTYSSKENFLDLTVTAGTKEYTETKPAGTELFRSPLVSFLYERGWRQNFAQSGFPGPDEEFRMAQEYFKAAEGGLLVDVSCGSGLFSRKFAQAGTYSGVIALDFSENMLRQCYEFIKKDDALLNSNLALVRADISRLPFQSGTVDAVHAGAALHCWPSPSNAIAEISRVLRRGGVFVGSTFLRYTPSTPPFLRPLRERALQSYNYLLEEEIKDLCLSCGLTNYSSKVQRAFIMFSAQKP